MICADGARAAEADVKNYVTLRSLLSVAVAPFCVSSFDSTFLTTGLEGGEANSGRRKRCIQSWHLTGWSSIRIANDSHKCFGCEM